MDGSYRNHKVLKDITHIKLYIYSLLFYLQYECSYDVLIVLYILLVTCTYYFDRSPLVRME